MSNFNTRELFMEPKTTQYGSHMIMTNVNKPSKKKLINVDTKFREEFSSHTYAEENEYTINLPDKVNEIKSMTVHTVDLPMSIFNVSSAIGNNAFQITNMNVAYDTVDASNVVLSNMSDVSTIINDPSMTNLWISDLSANDSRYVKYTDLIIIPDGHYTRVQLQDAIANEIKKLDRIIPSCMCSNINNPDTSDLQIVLIDDSQRRAEISTALSRIEIDFSVNEKGVVDRKNFKSSFGWMIGFRKPKYTATIYQNSLGYISDPTNDKQLSESVWNISIPPYIYLAIDEFNRGNQNSFNTSLSSSLINKNVIARISMNEHNYPFGTTITANKHNGLLVSDLREYNGKIDLQKLNVSLIYSNGHKVNTNGQDFSFLLELEYE